MLVSHWDGCEQHRRPDELVVEEPLTIRLDDVTVATTMRTPGHDFELAAGFCLTEGLLGDASVTSIRYCATEPATDAEFNLVTVETDGAPPATPRLGLTTSACGLCGAESIEALSERLHPLPDCGTPIAADVLAAVPERVRVSQDLFGTTGGVHAAAAFTAEGVPTLVREDIGRHNAVDKVVGRLLLDGELPAEGQGLVRERSGLVRDGAEGLGGRVRRVGGGQRPVGVGGGDRGGRGLVLDRLCPRWSTQPVLPQPSK